MTRETIGTVLDRMKPYLRRYAMTGRTQPRESAVGVQSSLRFPSAHPMMQQSRSPVDLMRELNTTKLNLAASRERGEKTEKLFRAVMATLRDVDEEEEVAETLLDTMAAALADCAEALSDRELMSNDAFAGKLKEATTRLAVGDDRCPLCLDQKEVGFFGEEPVGPRYEVEVAADLILHSPVVSGRALAKFGGDHVKAMRYVARLTAPDAWVYLPCPRCVTKEDPDALPNKQLLQLAGGTGGEGTTASGK